jgi:hypothetical protein
VTQLVHEIIVGKGYHNDTQAIAHFVFMLGKRYFSLDEMPPEAVNVWRTSYLFSEVLNGGLAQYISNTGWSPGTIAGTRAALDAIGAPDHLAVIDGVAAALGDVPKISSGIGRFLSIRDLLGSTIGTLEREHLSDARLNARFKKPAETTWDWGDRWKILEELSQRYIEGFHNIKRMNTSDQVAELNRLMLTIPDLELRKQKAEEARPWQHKRIDEVVKAAGQPDRGNSEDWMTTLSTRNYAGKSRTCWNMRLQSGHHQVIFHNGEALLFRGETDEIVARVAAPENR